MFSSVVSAFVFSAVWGVNQLTAEERAAWKGIEPSVAILLQGERPVGAAALIDKRGYFLAHRTAVPGSEAVAQVPGGFKVNLRQRAFDEPTQLVLLVATEWPVGRTVVAQTLPRELEPGVRLFAVLATGPVRAESSTQSLGIVNPSRRLMPMTEIKFEAPESTVGGALVFTQGGLFAGVLGATLSSEEDRGDATTTAKALGGAGVRLAPPAKNFGPSTLTVGYALAPDLLQRVVEGFKSPNHEVDHPVIGVMCRDASGGGAFVDRVIDNSPAQLAGMRAGDIIVELGGEPVRDQVDFAKVMLRQRVGATISAKVRRGSTYLIMPIRVGRSG